MAMLAPVQPVLCWEKSPLAVMLDIVSAAVPVLVTVIVCAGLDMPVMVLAKVSDVADSINCGLVVVPPPPVLVDPPELQPFTDSSPATKNIPTIANQGLDGSDAGNRTTESTSQLQAASFTGGDMAGSANPDLPPTGRMSSRTQVVAGRSRRAAWCRSSRRAAGSESAAPASG
jgi:hypothetical protein